MKKIIEYLPEAGIALMIILAILLICSVSKEYQRVSDECDKRGGVVIETTTGDYACVKIYED